MKRYFASVVATCALAMAFVSGKAMSQSLNVQMPLGSACLANYHWEMRDGFAQCVFNQPPTPPAPPVSAYNYIYIVGGNSVMCNSNGCRWETSVQRMIKGSGQWQTVSSALDIYTVPWGVDLQPLAALDPPTKDPGVLRSFMQPFVAANCLLASENAEAKSIISTSVGFNIENSVIAGVIMSGNNGVSTVTNYALCSSGFM